MSAREGKPPPGRVGVCGARRLRPAWIRGMAGVGALSAATGASNNSMSASSSSSSALFASEMCDMLPTPEADIEAEEDAAEEDAAKEDAIDLVLDGRERCARGEGVLRDKGEWALRPFEGVTLALVFPDRPSLALSPEVFGVEPLGVEDEGGRGAVVVAADVLTILFGREGDAGAVLVAETGTLGLVGELFGDGLRELVRFAVSAARCGRGLIGRSCFFSADTPGPPPTGLFCCSALFSSSDVLRRRRVPARTVTGDGGFVAGCSRAADLGRYFGSADTVVAVALRLRERSVAARLLLLIG